jgi:hypothetical protein
MNKRAQNKIDRIMSDAFDAAATVLEVEFRKLLDAKPERYSRFVLAVGWGPILFDQNGIGLNEEDCCAWGARLMKYAVEFYDRHGADNRQVYPTGHKAA